MEQANKDKSLTLLLVGDIMLGEDFVRFKEERGVSYEYPFKNVEESFEDADITFANLECTLSKSSAVREKGPNLYSPPESVDALKYLNCTVVSLGNNHINDFGEQGIIKTMEILKDNGISCFGAGRNLEEANREVIIESKGLKFCFLGYTTPENHVKAIIAGANTAGCVFYDSRKIEEDIKRVKAKSDIICISLHWGYESYIYPSPQQIELAHQIIEAGAGIVIGHHPHIIQGFERYKNGVIFYSLGNFFFPDFYSKSGDFHKWSKENNEIMIARCEINQMARVEKVEIFPGFRNDDYQVVILDGRDKENLILRIDDLSKAINRGDYKSFWNTYNKERIQKLAKALLKRMKELGIKGCIRKVSMGNIKTTIVLLIRYASTKLH